MLQRQLPVAMTRARFVLTRIAPLVALPFILSLAAMTSFAQPTAPVNAVKRPDPGWHAIMHATLIPEPGKKIDDATIVIRRGVIESVAAGARAPDGARVWDATGLTIYAGLIEPYATVDAPKPDASAEGAHWNPRVMAQRSALDGGGLSADARKKLRSGGVGIAGVAPNDGHFRGAAAIVFTREQSDGAPEAARMLVRRVFHVVSLDAGGGGGRGGGGAAGGERYPGSKMGAVALIRQTLMDSGWYTRAWSIHRAEPAKHERPAPNDALASLSEDLPLLWDVGDELDALRAAKISEEAKRKFVLVGSGNEYQRLEPIVELKVPLIIPPTMAEKPKVATEADREAVDLSELMSWEQSPTNLRRLAAAGATVALTSSKLARGQDFWGNLRKAIKHGVTEDQALAMLTTTPASILGIADRAGTVAPGKIANLVVVKGTLFDKEREIRDVWVDGQRYEIKAAPENDLEGSWNANFRVPEVIGGVTGTLKIGKKNDIGFERAGGPKDEPAADEKKDAAAKEDAPKEENKEEKRDKPRKPKNAKARSVSIVENRINFILDASAIGEKDAKGAVTVSGVIEKNTLTGHATLPDGTDFSWTAERLPGTPEEKAEGRKAEDGSEEGDKKDDAEKKDNGDTKDNEEDDAAPTDIPEKLGYPFGPYAYDALPEQKTLVVTNATIWTSGPQGNIENGWMLVVDGKIDSLGPGGAPRGLPDGTLVIDAKGKHITPGLIDCHSHTGISGGVNEGTHACTSEVRIFDVINPDAVGFYRELAGGLTGANQLHGSANPIGGQNSVVKLRWGVKHPDEMRVQGAIGGIKFALGENVKGSNWDSRPTPARYPQTRMGVETFIRDRFTAAKEYGGAWEKWNTLGDADKKAAAMPRRDLELEALWEILQDQRLIHCHSYRQDEILMLCRVAKDFGFRIGTFQHVLEGYKVAEAIKDHAIGGSSFSDWWAYKWEVFDAIPHNGAIMHDVGIPVSFNSDSDELARRMNTEAAKAVKYGGVPREEALKFVTLNPAKQLMIDDRTGSLEMGKDADFVIWSGDPLSTFSRCEATYIDGREYFSLKKDAEIRARITKERQRLIQKALADKSGGGRGEGGGNQPRRADSAQDSFPPRNQPPMGFDDSRADSNTGGRGRFFAPAGDGRTSEELADAEFAKRLEQHFTWMIRNGFDPFRSGPGDCGCSLNCLLSQE